MRIAYPYVVLFIVVFLFSCAASQTPNLKNERQSEIQFDALPLVVEASCNAKIVMLGEGHTHGEGTIISFKAALVETLISDCGFELVLFEANFYEFLKLNENLVSGKEIEKSELGTALGYIYRDKVELLPLIQSLIQKINVGKVIVGGIDYQPGGRGQNYSHNLMPGEVLSPALDHEKPV